MNKDGYKKFEWSNKQRVHTGLKLISIVITKTGIIELQTIPSSLKKLHL